MRRSVIVMAAAVGLAAAVLWSGRPAAPPAEPALMAPAPDFELADLGGQVVSLSRLRGKVVLLNFWASWCPSCVQEMPDLDRLHERLASKAFTVLALSVDQGRAPVMSFIARYNPSFPIAVSDRRTALAYDVFGLPVSFLIGKDGRIRRIYHGPIDEAVVENDILNLVSKS